MRPEQNYGVKAVSYRKVFSCVRLGSRAFAQVMVPFGPDASRYLKLGPTFQRFLTALQVQSPEELVRTDEEVQQMVAQEQAIEAAKNIASSQSGGAPA